MSASENHNLPKSLTLIGGPVDTNEAPTAVNDLATSRHQCTSGKSKEDQIKSHW